MTQRSEETLTHTVGFQPGPYVNGERLEQSGAGGDVCFRAQAMAACTRRSLERRRGLRWFREGVVEGAGAVLHTDSAVCGTQGESAVCLACKGRLIYYAPLPDKASCSKVFW